MKNYETKTVEQTTLESVTCDRCNKKFALSSDLALPCGEVEISFGYGSKHDKYNPDGTQDLIQFDICDDCATELFKWFGRTEE